MTRQKHIIRRQVVELQMTSKMDRHQLQDRVATLCYQQIIPLMDEVFSRLNIDDETARIDSLELNLGTIRLEQLEAHVMERMETELKKKFPTHLQPKKEPAQAAARPEAKAGSELDLVTWYLQTGLLPWWAAADTRDVAEKALEQALAQHPVLLKKQLRLLLNDTSQAKRFIYSFRASLRQQVVNLYLPGSAPAISAIEKQFLELVRRYTAAADLSTRFWLAVLQTSIQEQVNPGNYHLSIGLKLFRTFSEETASRNVFSSGEKRELALLEWLSLAFKLPPSSANLDQALKMIREVKDERSLTRASGSNTGSGSTATQTLRSKTTALSLFLSEWLRRQSAVFSQDLEAATTFLAGLNEPYGQTAVNEKNSFVNALKNQTGTVVQEEEHLPFPANAFDAANKLYIQNAGLVLLWPVLGRFFINTGLANEKNFFDAAAAEKGSLLLQHLAEGDGHDFFEAQLPLNKVLCGLPLTWPLNTGITITPAEATAGTHFIEAVIGHGPLWKDLSVGGFRTAYLQREAALSTRDGNWLLQVKRETYDIIVDRLPWSVQVVKLPWMKNLLFVEWQQT